MEKFITKHTPGPWRWEVNEKHKTMALCGGVRRYDLTVMGFERWGMGSAQISLIDTTKDGLNFMQKVSHWSVVVKGREHHADWFKGIFHPDAQLIEAAPLLLSALIDLISICEENPSVPGQWWSKGVPTNDQLNRAKAAIAAAGVVVKESKETAE